MNKLFQLVWLCLTYQYVLKHTNGKNCMADSAIEYPKHNFINFFLPIQQRNTKSL